MHSDYASLLIDVAPGLTVASAALVAALLPYLLMHQSRQGRARSGVAYLLGFFSGLAATAVIATALSPQNSAIIAAGALASFFGPFVGMLRARLRRTPRRPARNHAFSR